PERPQPPKEILPPCHSLAPLASRQNLAHRDRQVFPVRLFHLELFPAGTGQFVEASPAVVLRRAPLTLDPAAVFNAVEGRVEGTLLDGKPVLGELADALPDAVAVQGT